jgi:SAM-dependent methyltransferase
MDVIDLRDFYASALGKIVRRLIAHKLAARWPSVDGQDILGFGYTLPYLDAWRSKANMTAGFMPARLGAHHWPDEPPYSTCLVDDGNLPLPGASADRILVAHGLEPAEAPDDLLSELWRVLKPGGQLILVVSNRRGLWARSDKTPFGQGRPFSRGQLTHLLRNAMFTPVSWSHSLYFPASSRAFIRRSALIWERAGAWCWPAFSGALIVVAEKQVYAAMPRRAARRSLRELGPVGAPAPAGFKGRTFPRQ